MKRVLEVLALLALLGVVVGMIVLFVRFGPAVRDDAAIATRYLQYQAQAEVYKSRMTDYDGICRELGIAAPIMCGDSPVAYRIAERIPEGGFYCADSAGFTGHVPSVPGSALKCQ